MYRLSIYILLVVAACPPRLALAGNRNNVTHKYNVNGVCEQCKKRIENAAYIKGVKYAGWNVETHNLTLKYDSTKTTPEIILKSISKAGHDSELFKATDEDYNKLPTCCRYRSGIKMH